jgi:hypothetical protein
MLTGFLSADQLGKSTPYRQPVQEKSDNAMRNWQFVSSVRLHLLSAASRRVRLQIKNRKASIDVVAYPRHRTTQSTVVIVGRRF